MNRDEILAKYAKLKTKWNIHVVHNSHTDLGYTHRQEWVYRAHRNYMEDVINIIKKDKDFIWSVETFWMVENFLNSTTEEYKDLFHKFVKSGNIEINRNYLNASNVMDTEVVYRKALKAKELSPNDVSAVFQDVNSINRDYAKALSKAGTKYVLGSIHTHHGMFVGEGKQRPFYWDLGDGNKILVWNGEHYQLGNEIGLHLNKNHTYTFKDKVTDYTKDGFEQGLLRLFNYLEQLEEEGYEFTNLVIPVSGKVIDNSAASGAVLEGIRKFNDALPDSVNIKMSKITEFFESIESENKKIPTYTGEWSDWWNDGILSTPDMIRTYREAQRIYHVILSWNEKHKKISPERIEELENAIGIFAEHTWGHYSSVNDPYSNENNLLLLRKNGMADKVSLLAWTILDEIKEIEGENYSHLNGTSVATVLNPYNEEKTLRVGIQVCEWEDYQNLIINRYIRDIDSYEVVDEKGTVYDSVLTSCANGIENINFVGANGGGKVILIDITLKPFERKVFTVNPIKPKNISWNSSTRKVGVENIEDINVPFTSGCRFNSNGIENAFVKITWEQGIGITSIYDKELKKEIMTSDKLLVPYYDISEGSSRRNMGRNRRGPTFKRSIGKLVNVRQLIDKDSTQVVELIFEIEGSKYFSQTMRITKLSKDIDFNIKIQKQIESAPENLYLRLPFEKGRKVIGSAQDSFYELWEDHIPNSNIDFNAVHDGVIYEGEKDSVAVFMPDTPILQSGNINFERRDLMNDNLDKDRLTSYVWLMTNYWETNFKGTLEGNYNFAYSIRSGKKEDNKKWLKDKNKTFLSFANWK